MCGSGFTSSSSSQDHCSSHCLDGQRSNNHYAVWPPRFLRSQKSKDPSGPHFSDRVLVLEKSLRDLTLSCSLPSPWLLHGSPTRPFVQLFACLALCMLSSAREMRCPAHWEYHLDPPCLSTALALPCLFLLALVNYFPEFPLPRFNPVVSRRPFVRDHWASSVPTRNRAYRCSVNSHWVNMSTGLMPMEKPQFSSTVLTGRPSSPAFPCSCFSRVLLPSAGSDY